MLYYNGDVKMTDLSRGEERYLYRDSNTWQITRPGGDQLIVFSNGQEELRHRDGSLTLTFPDGTVKSVGREGQETVKFTDGTTITLRSDRILYIAFPIARDSMSRITIIGLSNPFIYPESRI